MPLSHLERKHVAWDVRAVYQFRVMCRSSTGGALHLQPVRGTEITTPLPYKARTTKKDKGKKADESDMSATDSCEEVGEECPSDVDPDAAVVNFSLRQAVVRREWQFVHFRR